MFIVLCNGSKHRNYDKPIFHDGRALKIKDGNHPVVEKMMRPNPVCPERLCVNGRDQYDTNNGSEHVR